MTETRVDPHVKVLDADVAARAKARGIDVLVYAPHFTRLPAIRERAAAFTDDDLLVVPAREVFTGPWQARRHVLALGLEDPVPDFITLDGAFGAFDEQDATVLAPHPTFATVSLGPADFERYGDRLAAGEVYNPKQWPYQNERARELVEAHGLPAFGSSYAHRRATVGEVWTTFERDIESAADLCAAFEDGAPRRVEHRTGWRHTLRCRAEFCHLAWENTYEKMDRVLLSGMEPTHPRHIAYEGRFDDVRVY
ncbi:putative metal-dependent phosphoesterase TrpH [Halarchaeum rubridurum]|uniref:Metal-dependent phosphoesterase n=1 Tax=Halarchaeum rubridurum TaxID=489911 RepID=A0A830FPH9_9EURY|nr:PHP domain-containing protein [Halarchaeum rubridurum]MBP1955254.1 putative metal-dependent phosphoesterase TrpH [Halarchaeum rubridurum]GGM67812.1 metal-dependent phosphoesterase [Halarchaeum rubridurum]